MMRLSLPFSVIALSGCDGADEKTTEDGTAPTGTVTETIETIDTETTPIDEPLDPAGTLEVGCTEENCFVTIQDAIDYSKNGAVISIYEGTYYENLAIDGKNIDLVANDFGVTVSGKENDAAEEGRDSVLKISNGAKVFVDGVDFTGGFAQNGGGLYVADSEIELYDVKISDNVAAENGGGLYLINSTLDMEDTEVSENDAAGGGGLYMTGFSGGNVYESEFKTNSAATGGAMHLSQSDPLSIIATDVKENLADTQGGGIYGIGLQTGQVEIIGGDFVGNMADLGGAAAFQDSREIYFDGVRTHENIARSGSSFSLIGSEVSYVGGRLNHNFAIGPYDIEAAEYLGNVELAASDLAESRIHFETYFGEGGIGPGLTWDYANSNNPSDVYFYGSYFWFYRFTSDAGAYDNVPFDCYTDPAAFGDNLGACDL